MEIWVILSVLGLLIASGIAVTLLIQMIQMRRKYGPLESMHRELEKVEQKKHFTEREIAQAKQVADSMLKELQRSCAGLEQQKTTLSSEVLALEGEKTLSECALYKPEYSFDTSEKYKHALDKNYDLQAQLIKSDRAAKCNTHWTVGGSEKEGARMARQTQKLMLRAFNGECDAAIAKVAWNNISRMEERIRKAHHTANDLGKSMQIEITDAYLSAKIAELRLTHEYEEKKHAEHEEQKRIREQMKEEEKAQREIERAREDAEADEARYAKALAKATEEAKHATGAKMEQLNGRVAELQQQLQAAQELKQRAISRAQMTRAGYVYVISNIGSFGENIYKVGMTRRLDPQDRVDELGNASVPFPFDVHAMIYSEDAPTLENDLHNLLHEKRVNLVNHHKEFFVADLDLIAQHAKKKGHQIEFTLVVEAKEYRKTQALRDSGKIAMAAR